MLGAIIGDLAAWTYENDRDAFWKQLVSNNSKDIELSAQSTNPVGRVYGG